MQLSHNRQQVVRTLCKPTKNIQQILGHMKLGFLAKKLKAVKRTPRKCSVSNLLLGYWELSSTGQFSYDRWAMCVSGLIGKTISGQAICKRMNPKMIDLLKEMLERSLEQRLGKLFDSSLFSSFSNVLVQDATHFGLPRSLADRFPGSFSKYGDCATAKVQAVFNLIGGHFVNIRVFSFRDNDQKDAPYIANMLDKGDLTIRDLGYCTLNALTAIIDKEGHFLSRFKYGTTIYDLNTGLRLNLLKHMKKHCGIDKWVEIGAKSPIRCRIVAVRLSDKVATERVRKAKADRNGKANHKKEYFDMLRYSIYITTVNQNVWSTEQVAQAYRCRWYIEILFKSWKSGLNMKFNIPERYVNEQRAEFFLYAGLLKVVLLVMPIMTSAIKLGKSTGHHISILKVCSFISQNITIVLSSKSMVRLLKQVVYHCHYERRKDRINTSEFLLLNTC